MNKYTWKITEILANGSVITGAKYHCEAGEVATEGYWYFNEPTEKTPYAEVTEQMVIDWINSEAIRDGKNLITSRLDEQIAALQDQKPVVAPWLPQVFTPEI